MVEKVKERNVVEEVINKRGVKDMTDNELFCGILKRLESLEYHWFKIHEHEGRLTSIDVANAYSEKPNKNIDVFYMNIKTSELNVNNIKEWNDILDYVNNFEKTNWEKVRFGSKVLVRDNKLDKWESGFFEKYKRDTDYPFCVYTIDNEGVHINDFAYCKLVDENDLDITIKDKEFGELVDIAVDLYRKVKSKKLKVETECAEKLIRYLSLIEGKRKFSVRGLHDIVMEQLGGNKNE